MRLYLFDDARARDWHPLSTTRPAGELLFGSMTLRERAERAMGVACAGHVRPGLEGWDEPGAPPVLPLSGIPTDEPRIFLNSRAALDLDGAFPDGGSHSLSVGGVVVGWTVAAEEPHPLPPTPPPRWDDAPVAGALLEYPWDLVRLNSQRLRADQARWDHAVTLPHDVHVLGAETVSIAADAGVEPGVILDARQGPIRLEEGVRVEGPARLTGPLWVGPDTVLLGGCVGPASIGPACKIRGEVSESVILGYANKAHDGYLGHAYLGRWVNLGALTTNSDLKNNYSTVRVATPGGRVDTGLTKVGVFLGDHVKTGIGTLLGTGAVVGAGSNVFGAASPGLDVPPFTWGSGASAQPYDLLRFLETAEAAMGRRAQSLTPGVRAALEDLWHTVHGGTRAT